MSFFKTASKNSPIFKNIVIKYLKMKKLSYFAVAAALVMLVASCSLFKKSTATDTAAGTTTAGSVSTSSTAASEAGSAAGTALKALYSSYSASGKLDLSNATNLLNVASLSSAISGLKGSDKDYKLSFAKGLVLGSNNLVNNTNSETVVDKLTTLAGSAASQAVTAASESTAAEKIGAVAENASTIGSAVSSILNIFKK